MTEKSHPTRRAAFGLAAAGLAGLMARPGLASTEDGLVVGDDGLHKQEWFLDSFLDMGEDLTEAADEGKGLLVLFEQQGCPYCRELHAVNFARPKLRDYLIANFNTVQIDLFGSRETTDFDGETYEERDLADRWRVHFTPTSVLIPASAVGSTSLAKAEGFRMPGYLKPFHYISALEFVATGAHAKQGFQRFLQDKLADLKAKGIEPDVW